MKSIEARLTRLELALAKPPSLLDLLMKVLTAANMRISTGSRSAFEAVGLDCNRSERLSSDRERGIAKVLMYGTDHLLDIAAQQRLIVLRS